MDGHVRANQAKPSGIAHKELVCTVNNVLSVLSVRHSPRK
jgi:hypothetical protein